MKDMSLRVTAAAPVDLLLEHLDPASATRIADVGANPLTPPPYQDLLERGGCHVFGFEPQPDAFDALQRAATAYETYFPAAVGRGGTAELKIFNDSGLTSVYEPEMGPIRFLGRSRHNVQVKERVTMQTCPLDAIDEIDRIDMLKIDVQGAEVEVFQGARRKLVDCVAVVTEMRFLRLYRGEPMMAGIDAELRAQGFEFHKFLFVKEKVIPNSQIHRLRRARHRNQAIDGDAVYIRDMGVPEACSDEALKHMAILASGVFDSHDLALHCLDLLVARGAAESDLPARYVDALPAELRKE